jgi:hypothetical protein
MIAESSAPAVDAWIGHSPTPSRGDTEEQPLSLHDAERLLGDWFERPVVLLASGRTGLSLLLQHAGLSRYEHVMWVPRYLSRCVINAITAHAFPVHSHRRPDASLAYHQFGFPQAWPGGGAASGFVIEDLAHSFFATPRGGARAWLSDSAIFSLPKFFPVAGLCGGVAVSTESQAAQLREIAGAPPAADDPTRTWMREVYRAASGAADGGDPRRAAWLASAYELLFQYPQVDPECLRGLPASRAALEEVGTARSERVALFRRITSSHQPESLWVGAEDLAPYALPYFPRGGAHSFAKARAALAELGARVDVYHLDVARSMTSPRYEPCLLLPAHQGIPIDTFEAMCLAVVDCDRG